jgi:hypothetical protein
MKYMQRMLTLILAVITVAEISISQENKVEIWDIFEIELIGPGTDNPFTDVKLSAYFINATDSVKVNGFYDGAGIYRIRFMPHKTGEWSYQTQSNHTELHQTGTFESLPSGDDNHGPVRIRDTYHFSYADGTPYYPVGTTAYRWMEAEKEIQDQSIRSLKNSSFNKLRMKVGPTVNGYDPVIRPYWFTSDRYDFTMPNPEYFQIFEEGIMRLRNIGIEAEVLFFHPYDKGTFYMGEMNREERLIYLDYIIARFGAFRNIWWGTNEFDLVEEWTMDDWDEIFEYLMKNDPYQHLRSNHNAAIMYDHAKPWITHVSIQGESWWMAQTMRERYNKPIIYDEFTYEGHGENRTAALSGDVMTHRMWLMMINGVYSTHGDATSHPDIKHRGFMDKGGAFYGTSHKQIGTLRKMMEEAPGPLEPLGDDWRLWNILAGSGEDYYIYYLGEYQNAVWRFYELPEGISYRAEIINTRTGEIIFYPEIIKKDSLITLPGKPYYAIRLQKLK